MRRLLWAVRSALWAVTAFLVLVGFLFAGTTLQVDPDPSRVLSRLLASALVGLYGWVPALFTAALAKVAGLLERGASR